MNLFFRETRSWLTKRKCKHSSLVREMSKIIFESKRKKTYRIAINNKKLDILNNSSEQLFNKSNEYLTLLNKIEIEMQTFPSKNLILAGLNREKSVKEHMYLLLSEKAEQTKITTASQKDNVRIIDKAYSAYKIKPKLKTNLIYGIILGIILSVLIIVMIEYLDQSLRSIDSIQKLGISVIGVIPQIGIKNSKMSKKLYNNKYSDRLITFLDPLNPVSEAYRGIRTNILYSNPEKNIKTIMVSSPGPSEGKTTLLDVFLGLLNPQEGLLLYNGKPLNKSLDEWRSQIAYLPQQVFIIDDSLRSNVALGIEVSEINDLKVENALRQARLMELVEQLPQGVNTLLGERGIRLSGGQRQRIAIARAFYHERSILVLDESTSALDNNTEKEIVNEIKYLKGMKTMIVIAHRLTTLQHCDRIYELKDGQFTKSGTYEEFNIEHKIA